MIAVDTNILVYAHREDSAFHKSAYEVLRELAEGFSTWSIPWPCLHEFLAIVTHTKIYNPATPMKSALEQAQAWLESPSLRMIGDSSDGYWESFKYLLIESKVCGAQIHDARIAAICLSHGIKTLYSADRDFSRFSKLKTVNPLG